LRTGGPVVRPPAADSPSGGSRYRTCVQPGSGSFRAFTGSPPFTGIWCRPPRGRERSRPGSGVSCHELSGECPDGSEEGSARPQCQVLARAAQSHDGHAFHPSPSRPMPLNATGQPSPYPCTPKTRSDSRLPPQALRPDLLTLGLPPTGLTGNRGPGHACLRACHHQHGNNLGAQGY